MLLLKRDLANLQSASATAAATSGASKAVRAGLYCRIAQKVGGDVPEKKRFIGANLHSKHLIEITIVNLSAPADAES